MRRAWRRPVPLRLRGSRCRRCYIAGCVKVLGYDTYKIDIMSARTSCSNTCWLYGHQLTRQSRTYYFLIMLCLVHFTYWRITDVNLRKSKSLVCQLGHEAEHQSPLLIKLLTIYPLQALKVPHLIDAEKSSQCTVCMTGIRKASRSQGHLESGMGESRSPNSPLGTTKA